MISEKFKTKINLIWNKYNNIYPIPQIERIAISYKDNSWAHFSYEDLYDQYYKIYVNEKLENQNDKMIEFVLFHEFTHLSDSIKFLKFSFEDFQKLMTIYSEVHASEILMEQILLTQNQKPYSLEKYITYNVKITLKDFMNQVLNDLENEFTYTNDLIFPYNFNRKKFYYFVGYLVALKKNNINYDFYFSNIDSMLSEVFYETILIFTDDESRNDYDLLIEYEDTIHETTLNIIKKHLGLPQKRT